MVVSGSGQANDPFLLSADVDFQIVDNLTFDLTLNGSGTAVDPWILSVNFSPTARLADFPDVSEATPTTGQVLAWNGTAWAPAPPTTAAAGSVTHNGTLTGDGSAGTPLAVVSDAARLLQASASTGVGLNDSGMASVTRKFSDATARNAMTPAPQVNSLTMLGTAPGTVDFWDGTKWGPITDRVGLSPGTAFLQLSGPYNGTSPITRLLSTMTATTDGSGNFTILSTATLTGRAGVLSIVFQETGSIAYKTVLSATGGQVIGKAYSLVNGAPITGTAVTGMYDAYCY